METYQISMLIFTGIMVLFTGIIAFSAYYGLVFQRQRMIEARRAEESETLMRITQRWDSEEFIKARQAVKQYEDNLQEVIGLFEQQNREEYFLLTKVAGYFEDIGSLVDRGYLKKELILDLLGDSARFYYKLYEGYINLGREKGDTDLYEHFEHLAKS